MWEQASVRSVVVQRVGLKVHKMRHKAQALKLFCYLLMHRMRHEGTLETRAPLTGCGNQICGSDSSGSGSSSAAAFSAASAKSVIGASPSESSSLSSASACVVQTVVGSTRQSKSVAREEHSRVDSA